MENRINCSVTGCYEDRRWFDNLFCDNCREFWIRFCKLKGIHEKETPPSLVKKYLDYFKTHMFK